MQHSKRMVLVPEGTVERFQQRQQVLTPPVTQQLKNLDSEMTDILTDKHLDDEEKARRYNQVLQRYLTFYDQRKEQPLSVKITAPAVIKTEQSTEVSNSHVRAHCKKLCKEDMYVCPLNRDIYIYIYIRTK